jgi:hypothetical protein
MLVAWKMLALKSSPAASVLSQLPILEAMHKFLKQANDHGSISRQETVSMVPPLFLDVQPHHKVRASRNAMWTSSDSVVSNSKSVVCITLYLIAGWE